MNHKNIPLAYSCSGCSGASQMANYLAMQLDKLEVAEMSCIAGVGGNVKKLVKTALSGRKIIAIDGCPLACVKACLGNHAITPEMHVELTKLGVQKKQHEDFDMQQANEILDKLQQEITGTFKEKRAPLEQHNLLQCVK
ncbi:zinc-binding protein [Panacibacter ginsenosidivorans]|uniref:Zinc-binding protein n=1 Tax=Panacibacter ginsenosidivorans TaxID=1813871 RepID=A0A5B8VDT7_9BACT|nr:putative zinc-binding protein [Panacibacter ginsenosidivorans]QEC69225.1 zinc-binding protein [Panacibacter ginsenosidivorans]